ncbi:hypothetical protein ACU8DI_11485 [Psychroserpens sp. BH13MA-6]
MNFPTVIAKSCLLAAVILWLIIATEGIDIQTIPIMFLTLIPVFMVSTLCILTTICPFFWMGKKKGFDKRHIFKIYYPFYAIMTFGISAFGIISSNFDVYSIAFFTSAFITSNQAWVWLSKTKVNETS